ncbi:aminotransferase class IV [Lentiprolixibacter aurantiacus]|uniref:branched-chain-amino-acid transaminase n=1 Tax=Lentiprolixibacter aurantiacus TaxID=2993939 RepID=A0AAE3SPU3_9FLAO|nr:aminotransferase class IV [Lentiprolixibacter aurantiacus]MCX2719807.1 aminotransferase class IV [Lentiprolixibacter aurantiacus]
MINYQGNLISEEDPILNHNNRGLILGDALYEDIKAVNGELYFWEEHYLRLMSSMRILRMEIPMNFTMEFLEEQIKAVIQANDLGNQPAFVRILVFRKHGADLFQEDNEVAYLIASEKGDAPFYTISEQAYEVELYKDFYLNADMLSNLNSTNRLLSVTGGIYARENGYQDCLLINASKNVVQALDGNLFLVKGNEVKTPPLKDGCRDGILRRKILEILQKTEDFKVFEASISPFELQKADELFITSIRKGIQPVTKYRKANFKTEVSRNLLGKLNALARLG